MIPMARTKYVRRQKPLSYDWVTIRTIVNRITVEDGVISYIDPIDAPIYALGTLPAADEVAVEVMIGRMYPSTIIVKIADLDDPIRVVEMAREVYFKVGL